MTPESHPAPAGARSDEEQFFDDVVGAAFAESFPEPVTSAN